MDQTYLNEKVKSLPHRPGVYIMRDEANTIIYVGKAVSLRNRVSSYFGSLTGQAPKVRSMVSHIADFEYIVVDTEAEALNLENTLIKQHRPKYNILMRDDKTYPYIKVTLNEKWPRVFIVRKVLDDGARYFGPFAGNGSAARTIKLLDKLFPYRSCDLNITGKEPRPCLEYFIHRCLGPCAGFADKGEYDAAIAQVIFFLEGKHAEIVQQLEDQMLQASENLQFEQAVVLRDQLTAVRGVVEQQKVVSSSSFDEDVVAMAREEGEAAVQVFFIRRGKLVGREHFMLQGTEDASDSDVLSSFVKQYYSEATFIPPRVLLQDPLEEAEAIQTWLSRRVWAEVRLEVPVESDKKDLVTMVAQNAKEALEQNRLRWLNDEQKTTSAMLELQQFLDLPTKPRRIECYDISNTQGTNSVASMVVFEDGSPKKSDYRKFKIKTVEGPNDFASMQEVLRRRFKRAKTVEEMNEVLEQDADATNDSAEIASELDSLVEQDEASTAMSVPDPHADQWGMRGHGMEAAATERKAQRNKSKNKKAKATLDSNSDTEAKPKQAKVDYSWQNLPDLIILDGGKGQLSAVVEVMRELEMSDIPIVGLAKQHDELFKPGETLSVYLPRNSQALYLVQRVRDEAHRFAITFHRQLRSKATYASPLDSVPGIGPKRKQALLKNFGTAEKIKAASDEELLALEGMNKAALAKIREYL
jgi:excinuclease ABC subunit C